MDTTLSAMLLLLGALHILSEHFANGFLTSARLWRSHQPSYLCLSHKWYTCANLTLFWDFRISVPWTKVSQPWPYCISEQIKFRCGGLSVPGKVCGLCPLDVSSTPSLGGDNQNVSRLCQCALGAKIISS